MIPFPVFEPDKSVFDIAAATVMQNVLPVQGGWGPMRAFEVIASALSEEPRGFFAAHATDGSWQLFVGTETKLHRYNSTNFDWDDVSQAATTYTLPDGDSWDFIQWGDTVIATNISDVKAVFTLASSSEFAVLSGSPPKSKYIDILDSYVVAKHLENDPYGVAWSDFDNSEEWITGDANSQSFTDGGGYVQGSSPGSKSLIILQKNKMRLMQYWPGTDYVFAFTVINEDRGTVAPQSIVSVGNTFFFLDEDGFYEGVNALPIGAEKVNRWFLENITSDNITQVQGTVDEANKMVFWRYEGNGGCKIVGYDWQLQRWAYIDQATSFIVNSVTIGTTMESLDNVSASLDDLTISLDSRTWLGGRPAFGGFNAAFEYGFFSGANMAVELETSDNELSGENQRTTLNGYRFVTDAATHTGQIGMKDNHGDSVTWSSEVAPYGTTGQITQMADARLHRFKAKIPQGTEWKHIHGIEIEAIASGKQ